MKIISEKTAINTGVAKSARMLGEVLTKNSKILDMGFGFGRNSVFLKNNYNYEIDGIETKFQLEEKKEHLKKLTCFSTVFKTEDVLNKKYNGILISYVINVILDKDDRVNLIKRAKSLLLPGGKLLIEVRAVGSLKAVKTKISHNDGFIVGKNEIKTFQKCYSKKSLEELIEKSGFNNYKIINNGHSIIAVITQNTCFGQMCLKYISKKANYLQLDICGLSKEEAIKRYKNYKTNIPIILHGDWQKKGASENNLKERKNEYIKIINELSKETTILGLTLHPPSKTKFSLEELKNEIKWIEDKTNINVFLENRSSNRFLVSTPEEVINFSKDNKMTIDIPQLYIACGNDNNLFLKTLHNLKWSNIKEIHLGGLLEKRINKGDKRNGNYVAQQLNEKNSIDYSEIKYQLLKTPFITFEILGSHKTFEKNLEIFLKY